MLKGAYKSNNKLSCISLSDLNVKVLLGRLEIGRQTIKFIKLGFHNKLEVTGKQPL